MNLKNTLAIALEVLLLIGSLTYIYVLYAIYNDADSNNNTGQKVVKAHGTIVYTELFILLLQLVVGGLVVYKS